MMPRRNGCWVVIFAALATAILSGDARAAPKPLISYFRPTPIIGTLTTSGWGIGTSGPRDPDNGIEDIAHWRYWDGKIIKAPDGTYHLFCSKWPAADGIDGWLSDSVSVHATSKNVLGPYREIGPTYTYQNSRGHNTTGLTLLDGTYAVLESAIVPGWIFTSPTLAGPFTYQGSIAWNGNGYNPQNVTSNLQIAIGGDNRYWAIGSSGFVLSSDKLLGTFQTLGPSIYPTIVGTNNGRAEDPIIWYSGGYYHVVYNYWDIRRAYHIMSVDGIHNWTSTGVAVDRTTDTFQYMDGTVNHWGNMERPNVYMENGHVAYFTFAVTDQNKDQSNNCCSTGSKVIVVPFDGASFDNDNGGLGGFGGGGGAAGGGGLAGGASGAGGGAGGAGGKGPGGFGGRSVGGSGGLSNGAGGASGASGAGGKVSSGAGGRTGPGTGGESSSAGGTGTRGQGGAMAGSTGGVTQGTDNSSGCSCRSAAAGTSSWEQAMSLLVALGLVTSSRQRRTAMGRPTTVASTSRAGGGCRSAKIGAVREPSRPAVVILDQR